MITICLNYQEVMHYSKHEARSTLGIRSLAEEKLFGTAIF